ncbi:hypothetical protein HYX10_00595 [Candidatus Woesearchaeota archaeon]|nr:hypothetical protein [Candidatus Woesearchaeota archaeon]
MKLILISLFAVMLAAACTPSGPAEAPVSEITPPETTATEADIQSVSEPTAEQIESELDTSELDAINDDLDLMIVE